MPLADNRKKVLSVPTVPIKASTHKQLKAISKRTGQKITFMVNQAMEAWLARQATNALIHRLHTRVRKRTPKMRAGNAR